MPETRKYDKTSVYLTPHDRRRLEATGLKAAEVFREGLAAVESARRAGPGLLELRADGTYIWRAGR